LLGWQGRADPQGGQRSGAAEGSGGPELEPESVGGGGTQFGQGAVDSTMARRGYGPRTVELARRFFNGQIAPNEMMPALLRFGGAYYHDPSLVLLARELLRGGWRTKTRPEALIFAGRQLFKGWTVMDRLDQITVPTLVLAGRDDFLFPPEHQRQLAAGIPGARLQIIERAGHNAHSEQSAEVLRAVTDFISTDGGLLVADREYRCDIPEQSRPASL
jgi:pimeloyl-ACP methyl ester carboxylesterase